MPRGDFTGEGAEPLRSPRSENQFAPPFVLSPADRHQLLVEWNNTATEYPRDKCIHQLFEEQVARTPEAVAVVFEEQHLTYRELNERANRVAHALHQRGIGHEQCVGLLLDRSVEFVVLVLGILKAGAAYLPLDRDQPAARLQGILRTANARLVIGCDPASAVALTGAGIPFVDWDTLRQETPAGNTDRLPAPPTATDLAYVMFTSGSTGEPKGVMVPHRAVVRLVSGQRYLPFHERLTFLLLSPPAFDASTLELWGPLLHGGKLVIYPAGALDLTQLGETITKQEVTCLWLTSALFNVVLDQRPEALTAIKYLLSGGEALSVPHVRRVLAQLPQTRIINGYGPTEGTTFTTTYAVNGKLTEAVNSMPIGRPLANTQVYVLDPKLQPVPIGVAGELHVGGDGLARGYLNRPELTAEKFILNPFSPEPGARLYKTGDLCRYLPDGNIEFLGRLDHQVKIRGFRIELGEIEAVLGTHPGVQGAVVVTRETSVGDKRLVAYVVAREQPNPGVAKLREFLRETLPDYMIPAVFVALDALPLTPNGKIDRQALPVPTQDNQLGAETTYIAPRTPTEEKLAAIWAEVLGRHPISIHDNFLHLGGHSLNAVQIAARARSVLCKALPIRSIIESMTIAKLSEAADRLPTVSQTEPNRATSAATLAISAGSAPNRFPASINQAQLWFLQQLQPESCAYNLAHQLRFRGQLNIPALVSSLEGITRRHAILRARFDSDEGNPVCVINPTSPLDLPVIDLTASSSELREQELQRLASEEISQPFDLAKGPLLRGKLIRLDAQDHVLLLGIHHIVYDGWSTHILFRELSQSYQCYGQPLEAPPQESAFQFADFVTWQSENLSPERRVAQLAFWRQELTDVPTIFALPFPPPPKPQSRRQQQHSLILSAEATAALRSLAQSRSVTLFATLLASFQALLFRYTGQAQFLLGVPFAGRPDGPAHDLIGYFVNSLPVKADFSNATTFSDFLSQIQARLWEVQAHQDFPFEKLVKEFCPNREPGQNPLFQIMVAFEDLRHTAIALPGLTLEVAEVTPTTAMFDLTLLFKDRGAELECAFLFDCKRYDASVLAQVAHHFQVLLQSIQANPQQRVTELALLSPAERQQLLVEWNNTATEYPRDKCIHQLFEEQVVRTPDATAVVCADQQLTYQQLNRRANELAHQLRAMGIGPDDLVGLCVSPSLELAVAVWGILKAGAAYLPLDPTYPKARLEFMAGDARLRCVITTSELSSTLPEGIGRVVKLTSRSVGGDTDALDSNLTGNSSPEQMAYVIYTSGSTGQPKGVMVSHRGLVNYLCWAVRHYEVEAGTGAPVHSSLSFDLTVTSFFTPLLRGRSVRLVAPDFGVEQLLQALRTQRNCSLVKITPAHLRLLQEQLRPEEVAGLARYIVIGGEALPGPLVEFWQQHAPDTVLVNEYGPTETVVGCCVFDLPRGQRFAGEVPIGRPIANTQIYILDEDRKPVPIGVAGELFIGGDGVARGYLNRPELTAEKFIPNPFSSEAGARLYKTGDLCRYLPDGNLEFLGRLDHQVKIRGFRIELGEIEAAIGTHPGIHGAVVVARESARDQRLVAYVVAREEPGPGVAELREFLRATLPEYMIPAAFVKLASFPLNANGKIDRKALPESPEDSLARGTEYVAPRTEAELKLAAIWSEVLGVAKIGIHDNFFDLGGHSLMATRVVSRIAQRCEITLPLRVLFEKPTIADLSAEIETLQAAQVAETEDLLKLLEGMSEEEARKLLG